MEDITKIKEVHLGKFNNAEYTQFLSNTKELIEKTTLETLMLDAEVFDAFKENIKLLTDSLQESRISNETKELALLDKQRNEALLFLQMNFRSEQKNPIEKRRKAGTELYNVTKPYSKVRTLPVRQKTQMIEGFIADVTKEGVAQNLTTLGIKEAVEKLASINAQYKRLTANRADSQAAIMKVNVKELRKKADKQYDYLTTRAFVTSVATPSEEAKAFVSSINKLIVDTNTAYKQRQTGKRLKEPGMKDEE